MRTIDLQLPLLQAEDGSVLTAKKSVLHFSADRFARDICDGDCCFICGASPKDVKFNREHVLPDWIIRKYGLHKQTITLPNGQQHQYGTYKTPCCVECNSLLSEVYEQPLSKVLSSGHDAVVSYVRNGGAQTLFTWLALIFLKTHLKDTSLRLHLREDAGKQSIAADYAWRDFHHLHCLARSAYTGAHIESEAFGSLMVVPTKIEPEMIPFDLIDLSVAQTLVLRMDDFALCATFNDGCAVNIGLQSLLGKIRGALNWIQTRELAAQFACCNLHLKNRPTFHTRLDFSSRPYVFIGAQHDEVPSFEDKDPELFGALMEQVVLSTEADLRIDGYSPKEVHRSVRAGEVTFLLDSSGNFLST